MLHRNTDTQATDMQHKLPNVPTFSNHSTVAIRGLSFYLNAIINSVLANGVSSAFGFGIANFLFFSLLISPLTLTSFGLAIVSGSFILSVSLALLDAVISFFHEFDLPNSTAITCGYISIAPLIGSAVTGIPIWPLLICSLLGAATVYLIAKLSGDDATPEISLRANRDRQVSKASI